VESIPLTINGKPDLEALPDPLSKRLDEYEPPADRVEEELVTLWSEVLNIPRGHIGVTANFFDLGGHSLKATLLTAHIHKKLDVELSLAEVFKFPNIKELSGIIRVKAKHAYTFIEPLEKKEYYPLSSAQKRLYFLQQMDLNSTAYNMSLVLLLGKDIDKDGLENTLKKLIRRHEGLRTSFEVVKGEPVQRIHDEAELEIEYYNFRIPKILQEFVRPFDLSKAPLIRSGLIKTHDGNYTWLVDIHHIVSDGTSHTVLAEDFAALYREEELEPLRLHYKDFSGWQNRLFASGKIKNQEDYWLGLYAGEIPRLHMPADYRRPEVFTFAGAHYYFALPGEDGLKFKTLASRHGGTLYMNILAALNTLCYKYTGQTDIIIGSGIAGRPHADLQRIIGMFVNTLAMRNYPAGEKTYESFLEEVIAHSVEAFENQDVQFEELVERLDPERDPSRNPLFDISMVVQNFRRINEVVAIRNEDDGEKPDRVEGPPLTTTKFDLTFFIVESGGNDNVYFDVEYYTGIFKEETVKRLANHFGNIVKTVVNNPSVMLKDIDIISEDEKKQVLGEFNDTERDYPCHKTIHRLFAEQMEKTPDHTAVISRGQGNISVTYRELNEKSGRLAGYLYYEKHIRPEEPVGISMSEPIELAVGILGILKSGAAYVPLDPSLPEERLKYMIDDSRTGMVVSEKRYIKTLERLQWQCNGFHSYLCMDSRDIEGEWEVEHSELMDEELWNHVAETGEDEITRGGWLSSYTGLPFSRLEMDEYGDNIFKKLEPLLNPEMRVLEIGCASGITMYRIAPKVGLYYGTDLSPVMIDGNKKKTAEQGQQNIKLSCLAAHEIDRIEERNFDLVIMNSVIQCFHGHHYLRKVLKKAIDLLGEKGFLFLGDIMDQEKKDVLIRELETFKSTNPDKGYNTKTDFSSELFISRGFWEDFGVESGVIEDICFSDKLHTVENELTGFRYDVLITVNKSIPGGGWKKWRKQKYREDGTGLLEFSGQRPPPLAASNNLAYIIYTSGTTGQPKGVEVEHCAAVNTLCCRKVEYGMNSQCTALQLFSYGFDGFVTGFFTPLISGARLIVLPAEELGDVDQIKASILKNSVTHFICVPPLYSALLESMTGEELSTLKAVTLAGDRVSAALVARTKEKYEHIEIINEYGVTEAAVMSTIYRGQDGDNTVKIGHPVWNTQIFILDEGERLQPVGVPGELCISGVGLARGYLNKPELTAERFVDYRSYRTYRTYISSKKIYKTGDRARWLSEGNIEFLGRIDHQVKIRGFRIEMGEIESLLLKHESIKEVVVIDRENEQGDKYLCAYIKVGGAFKLNHAELKEYLSRSLPDYMIPRFFVPLDKIPITPNGKVDRKKLPEPGFRPGEAYVAPETETEEKLAAVWAEVLGIDKEVVGVESGFFELGGHSLSLIKMKAGIKEAFNMDIPVARLFQLPTIRAIASYIQGEETNRQVAEEILVESAASMETTLRLFEEFEDE
jgi:amino acid adenylation domain-containing protein